MRTEDLNFNIRWTEQHVEGGVGFKLMRTDEISEVILVTRFQRRSSSFDHFVLDWINLNIFKASCRDMIFSLLFKQFIQDDIAIRDSFNIKSF